MGRYKKLTLLHSNDMHGDFHAEMTDNTLIGGVSMLSGYVNKVRREEKNVLYCIAGDMFRGSVIDSEYKGISTIEIMNAISPDVVSLGNHEIDYGVAHLLFLEKCARFPIINANLYIKTSHTRLFNPVFIKEIDGMKILFIGIITETVLRSTKNEDHIGTVVDVFEAAEEVGRICNAYRSTNIDLTVLLTHIGFEQDKLLASQLKLEWGVDIIIGGHSHTYLEHPEFINGIQIVQAKTGTDLIGRFDLMIDTENNCIASSQWRCVPMTKEHCPNDDDLEKMIAAYQSETDKKYKKVVTRLPGKLQQLSRIGQSEIGTLFTDLIQDAKSLDVMFLASGSIRSTSFGPLFQYSDLISAFPYDGPVFMMRIRGSDLKRMVHYMLRDDVLSGKVSGYFQMSSNVQIEYEQSSHSFLRFDIKQKPLDEQKVYRIGLLKYHYQSYDSFFGLSRKELEAVYPSSIIATSAQEILYESLVSLKNISALNEERIIIYQ